MYKLGTIPFGAEKITSVITISGYSCIPFDTANTDYQQFKLDITNGVELQDADGQVMTAEQVQAFLETLP